MVCSGDQLWGGWDDGGGASEAVAGGCQENATRHIACKRVTWLGAANVLGKVEELGVGKGQSRRIGRHAVHTTHVG